MSEHEKYHEHIQRTHDTFCKTVRNREERIENIILMCYN